MIIINGRFLSQQTSGVQRYANEVSKEIAKINKQVVILAPKNIIGSLISDEIKIIRFGFLKGHLWEQIELPLYIFYKGYKKFTLLNLCNTAPILIKNKISTIHDVAFLKIPHSFSHIFRLFYKIFIPIIINTSKSIITVSKFSAKEIKDSLNLKKIKIDIVNPFIKEDFFSDLQNLRKNKIVLTVSSFSPHKNLERLIKAFSLLDDNSLTLLIIGEEHKNFSSTSTHLTPDSRIKFLGRVSDLDLKRYYEKATCFIFPSLYEGFGLPPLEAQASNCPCIVSDAASLPEVFQNSVLYCDPYSINDIKDKINEMLTNKDLRDMYKNLGFKNAKRFSAEISAKKIIEIINEN